MKGDHEDEELMAIEHFATVVMVTAVTVIVVGVAVAWSAISLTAEAVQAVRRKP